MTPPQQQKENILWQNFHSLVNSLKISAEERASLFYWENEIRSRPATTPAPCPQHKIWQHCPVAGDIAAQAREDVLKLFSGFIDGYSRQDEDGHDYVSVLALQNHIESLRSSSTKETSP